MALIAINAAIAVEIVTNEMTKQPLDFVRGSGESGALYGFSSMAAILPRQPSG